MTDIPVEAIRAPDVTLVPPEWKDAASWQFEAFMLHNHTQVCTTCSSVHRWSETFRMFVKRNPAAVDRRYVPATYVPEKLTVITSAMPVKRVPLCFHCLTEDRVGEQRILVSTDTEWSEAMKRSLDHHRRVETKTSVPSKPEAALEDLL